MQDFTLTTYKMLIQELLTNGYSFQTLQYFIQQPEDKTVILRHDVDHKPGNSLKTALLENELGIRATYFFRTIPETFKPQIIKEIAEMGHEIGYHYENLSEISKENPQITQIDADYLISHRRTQTHTDIYPADFAGQKESSLREKKPKRWRNDPHSGGIRSAFVKYATLVTNMNLTWQAVTNEFHGAGINADEKKMEFRDKFFELAIDDFRLNLEKFRKLYPVKTICMHGSPLSKWDNRDLWKRYDYRDFEIIAEPYFDIDFDEVFYLTDTGRRWDGDKVSVRDKVKGTEIGGRRSEVRHKDRTFRNLRFRSTWDIIEAAERGLLPDKVMLNTHPQRWTDNTVEWTKELVWQNFKNVIKRIYVRTWER